MLCRNYKLRRLRVLLVFQRSRGLLLIDGLSLQNVSVLLVRRGPECCHRVAIVCDQVL